MLLNITLPGAGAGTGTGASGVAMVDSVDHWGALAPLAVTCVPAAAHSNRREGPSASDDVQFEALESLKGSALFSADPRGKQSAGSSLSCSVTLPALSCSVTLPALSFARLSLPLE